MLLLPETIVKINGDLQILKVTRKTKMLVKQASCFIHTPVNLSIILAIEFNVCKGCSFRLNES